MEIVFVVEVVLPIVHLQHNVIVLVGGASSWLQLDTLPVSNLTNSTPPYVANSAQPASSEIARRLAELQFETTLSNERRLLQDAIRRQQSDRLLQNERQFDALEKEIIRQQILN